MQRTVNYDAVAPTYDQRYQSNQYPGTLGVIDAIARRRTGLRALEVGCGTGHWLAILRERGALVAGLDRSEGMLARARELVPEADLQLGSAERLPWPDASFELVLCNNALHHFPDKPGFIAEAHRVLRSGGELVVIGLEPNAVQSWAIYDYFEGTRERDLQRFPAAAQLQPWLREAGFVDYTSHSVEHVQFRRLAREALDRGLLDQHVTSQLSLLSQSDYERGVQKLRAAIAAAETRGEALWVEADLHLYGTFGRRA